MPKPIIYLNLLFIALYLFPTCSSVNSSKEDETNFTSQRGYYLGQTPPGTTPARFAVGDFLAQGNWFWHGPLCFSPNGNELYFAKIIDGKNIKLYYSKMIDNKWIIPERPSFCSSGESNCPVLSADGNDLYYIYNSSINKVTRISSGWSNPQRINIPTSLFIGWQFCVAADKSIYIELWSNNQSDIYRSAFSEGLYRSPVLLDGDVNTQYNDFCPFVSQEQDYIIFSSNRPGGRGNHDLYISFKNSDGSWGDVINLGTSINSASEECNPYVSPDGDYFFYTTEKSGDQGYNPYWVSINVLENIKP